MVVFIDPAQTFQDSPQFRQDIELAEESLERFLEALKKISNISRRCVDAEKAAIESNIQLAEEIATLVNVDGNVSYENEGNIATALNRFSQVLKQLQQLRENLISDLEASLIISSQKFFNVDIPEVKKQRLKFDTDYNEYETELNKYCAIPRKRETSQECTAQTNSLRAARKTFHASSLSYVELLNDLNSTKKIHFLETLVSYMHSASSFYSKSNKLLDDNGPFLKEVTITTQEKKGQATNDRKNEQAKGIQYLEDGVQLFSRLLQPSSSSSKNSQNGETNIKRQNSTESNHSLSSNSTGMKHSEDSSDTSNTEKTQLVPMSGYMFKRSSGARKVWSRRFFVVNYHDCRLDYFSPKDPETPNVAVDLISAVVKDADYDDRRFVMQITSPNVNYYLQAENEGELNDWKNAITNASQHGPLNHDAPRNLPNSGSFASLTALPNQRTRPASDIIDESAISEDGTIRSGGLFYKKGGRRAIVLTFSRSQPLESSSQSSSDWKKIYVTLSKDYRLVLFDHDKDASTKYASISRRAVLTKIIASIDVSSLEKYSIQSTHETASGRRHSFSIQTRDKILHLAAASELEKDEWMSICNQIILDKHFKTNNLRTAVSLYIEVHEARNIAIGDVYIESRMDEVHLSSTSVRFKTQTPYWGENFTFDDLREVDLGMIFSLKNHSGSRLQRDNNIGYAFIPSETLVLYGHFEGWLPIFKGTFQGKAGLPSERETQKEQKGELKVHIRYQTMEVMTVDKYDDLSNLLDNLAPEPLLEIGKASDHLEGAARNLLRIYLGKGTATEWIKKLVGCEIMLTENTNVIFRANSLATKTLDQYMKHVGMGYLEKTLGEVIRSICDSKQSCEVDPTKLAKGEDITQNWARLIENVTKVWTQISKSLEDMPNEFRSIFKHIQQTAHEKFGHDEQLSTVRYITVSGFLFLRFFCPAVLTPKFFGLLNDHPDERAKRTLTLIAKTLQCLANLGNFSVKEAFMAQMNEFLMDQNVNMMDFIDEASKCRKEPEPQVYPIDLAREYAQFQLFVSSKTDILENSKSQQIQALIKVVGKLDSVADKFEKVSLVNFLKNTS